MLDAPRRRPVERAASIPVDAAVVHVHGRELPDEDVVVAPTPRVALAMRLVYLVAGLGAFVTALGLMKAGAAELAPKLEGSIFTDNAWSTLGLGWLFACIVLSGSPVAASSLSLLDGGTIDRTQSFTMLTGSRLGAAFVVLVVGVIYTIRRSGTAGRRAPISIGILSLLMTMVTYVPAALVGYLLLERGTFDGFDIGTSPSIHVGERTACSDRAVDICRDVLPDWMLFPVGLLVLLGGFALFDRVLPAVGGERSATTPMPRTRASGRCSSSAAASACSPCRCPWR